MESRLPKIKSIVKQTANWVIRIMGSLILLFLVWYAMRTLQYMLPVAGHEDLVEIPDSVIRNLAAAALILLLYAVLTAVEKKAGDKITIWCKRIAVTLGMLWQGIAGLCWVLAADRVPSADQASVIGAAIDFIQGDYGTLAPDHYCGLYAHQLGPAAMEEMLFRILGEADYHVIQEDLRWWPWGHCLRAAVWHLSFIPAGSTERFPGYSVPCFPHGCWSDISNMEKRDHWWAL